MKLNSGRHSCQNDISLLHLFHHFHQNHMNRVEFLRPDKAIWLVRAAGHTILLDNLPFHKPWPNLLLNHHMVSQHTTEMAVARSAQEDNSHRSNSLLIIPHQPMLKYRKFSTQDTNLIHLNNIHHHLLDPHTPSIHHTHKATNTHHPPQQLLSQSNKPPISSPHHSNSNSHPLHPQDLHPQSRQTQRKMPSSTPSPGLSRRPYTRTPHSPIQRRNLSSPNHTHSTQQWPRSRAKSRTSIRFMLPSNQIPPSCNNPFTVQMLQLQMHRFAPRLRLRPPRQLCHLPRLWRIRNRVSRPSTRFWSLRPLWANNYTISSRRSRGCSMHCMLYRRLLFAG